MYLKKPILTYLEWEDATANSGWFGKQEAKDWVLKTRGLIREIGWIYFESKEKIGMFSRWCPADEVGDDKVGALQMIPKTWIRKRKVIKL